MKSPTAGWAVFNLFRLSAVVILVLALVAQFIALASDLKAQSEAKHPIADLTSGDDANDTSTRILSSASRDSSRSSSIIVDPLPPVIATSPTSTSRPPARTTPLISLDELTTTALRPTNLLTAIRATQAAQTDVLMVPATRQLSKRAEEETGEEPVNGTYGLSSIPTSPGGILFAAMSRVLMVSILSLLILAQLGIPEMWLYRNTPIFGPQTTPLWYGLAQIAVAVENLRVYSVNFVWTTLVILLVIGMINVHLALVLIFLARRRKLPKSPSPPLYFSHTTRLLFFRPDPPSYLQLLTKDNDDDARMGKPAAQGRTRGLQVTIGEPELGAPALPFASRNDAVTDVRQGGYPTFARGVLAAPGSQVPAGVIDSGPDGRVRGFTSRPLCDTRSIETGDAYSGVADDESRAETDARSLAGRNASVSSLGSQRINKGKRKPAPLIGIEHSSTSSQPGESRRDERQRNIETLREKLSGRMERKALADTQRNGVGGSSRSVIGHPVLQRSTSTQVNGPGMLNVGPDATPRTGGPVLPGIPKRSNTLDQASARTPKPQLTVSPPTAKSVRQQDPTRSIAPPAPPSKSPSKSLAGSLYSSMLPWTRSSRPGSPVRFDPKPKPPVPSVRPNEKRQNAPVAPAATVQTRPRPHRIDQLAGAGGINPGVPGPRAPSPLGLTRTNSGSKLQKKAKDGRGPSPLPPVETESQSQKQIPAPETISKHVPGPYSGTQAGASLGAALNTESPLTRMIESVKAKTHGIPELSPDPVTKSPSPPASPPMRPKTTQSMYPNSTLRSSLAQLQRADSTKSARSARTAMGVRFDLEKRHSLSDEDLMSPSTEMTATPRSAGFRIPYTKLTIPFPSTPRKRISQGSSAASTPTDNFRRESGLILDMNNIEDDSASFMSSEIEAARPESVASQSSAGSLYHRRALDDLNGVKHDNGLNQSSIRRISERAGLPKRSNTVVHDADKQARRSHAVILGGTYLDGGEEKDIRGHRRKPNSTDPAV